MAGTPSDRNLLVGVLALQLGFVGKDQLLSALAAWLLHKDRPLEDLLREQKALSEDGWQKLQAVVQIHLAQHGGDAEKSLAAISSVGSVREEIAALGDAGLEASLQQLSLAGAGKEQESDPYRTIGGGQTTSEGVRFRILRPHAKGGLGEVSVALDSELNREVALKEIQSKFADVSESRARFMLEAQITGGLEHPGIVPVYGMGTYADGRPFYAMRFIRGDSLKDGVRKFFAKFGKTGVEENTEDAGKTVKLPAAAYESLDFRQLLGRFVDVCNAVAYAHARGVLHRDLKPGNIMLGNYGETLVVDWGLAKATGQADESLDTTQAPLTASTESGSAETRLGSALGTPGYMSPEQAAGRTDQFGPATDIYCLGATLYHLLTGRPPHLENEGGNLLQRIQSGEFPRPRDLNPVIPAPLAAICLKAMATEQKHRYPTALSLAADIERFLADDPVTAHRDSLLVRAQRWSRRHRTLVTAAAALLLTATLTATLGYFALSAEQSRTLLAKKKAEDAETKAKASEASEREERNKATVALVESRKQLAANYFQHGLSEENAGRAIDAEYYLCRALALTPTEDVHYSAYRQVLLDRLVRVITCPLRHEDAVLFVSFSPDGRKVLSTSADNTACIWDAETGSMLAKPFFHDGEVNTASFSPDGRKVITASDDKTACIWDAETGSMLAKPFFHDGEVNTALFSPDGRKVVTASDDKTACIWDAESGSMLAKLIRHEGKVNAASFSRDGKKVITASSDKTACIWDTETGSLLAKLLRHEGEVNTASFSPNGRMVITSGEDEIACLWDSVTGKLLTEPLRHESSVKNASFCEDGRKVITGSEDGTACIWDAESGNLILDPLRHEDSVATASFSPDGLKVITASGDSATIWDAVSGRVLADSLKHKFYINSACFSPDGKRAITASADNTARIWNASTGASRSIKLTKNESVIIFAAYSPDGKKAITTNGGCARMWDTMSGRLISEAFCHKGFINTAAFNLDGRKLVTASKDKTACIWDAASGNMLIKPLIHDSEVSTAFFSPDGRKVITACKFGAVRIWDAVTGEIIAEPSIDYDFPVSTAFFSPDGRKAAVVHGEAVCIWDVLTGSPLGEPLIHGDLSFKTASFGRDGMIKSTGSRSATLGILAACFSPDGRKVITASYNDARIWSVETGDPLISPLRHEDRVATVAFSADGSKVVTGSWDRSARIWDAETGVLLAKPLRHDSHVLSAFFSPDDRNVLTAGPFSANIWNIEQAGDAFPLAITDIAVEFLTGNKILPNGKSELISNADLKLRRDRLEQTGSWLAYQNRMAAIWIQEHHREANFAESIGAWFAAAFHWKQLLLEKPSDAEILQRVAECEAKWRAEVEAAERAAKEKVKSKPQPPRPVADE